ncbi:MAG TPA: hypothetical protein VJN88_13085 [Ktedonobacterales bacterium]|nr:hypothetical protein [Ktedonobacterales bacterium]
MSFLSMAIAFTLNDRTVWILAGALGGFLTGQLLNSKGLNVLGDLFFGSIGALLGVYIAGPILQMTHHGTDARTILASAGGVASLIFARFALALRRHLKTV